MRPPGKKHIEVAVGQLLFSLILICYLLDCWGKKSQTTHEAFVSAVTGIFLAIPKLINLSFDEKMCVCYHDGDVAEGASAFLFKSFTWCNNRGHCLSFQLSIICHPANPSNPFEKLHYCLL